MTLQLLTARTATFVLLTLWPWQAAACMFGDHIQRTLFFELPAALETQPIVARIKVVRVFTPKGAGLMQLNTGPETLLHAAVALSSAVILVEVVDGIRGVADGEQLSVGLPMHSCSVALDRTEIGTELYIAGEMINGFFSGSWSPSSIEQLK